MQGILVLVAVGPWLAWTAYRWLPPLVEWGVLPEFVVHPVVRPIDLFAHLGLWGLVALVPPIAVAALVRRWWVVFVCLALVVLSVPFAQPAGGWWSGTFYHRVHRAEFAAVAAFLDGPGFTQHPDRATYYGVPLPPELAHLSATGKVSDGDGAPFLPVWTGIPDDAGGFLRVEHSPAGRNMYGLLCTEPEPMGDGWWACGLPTG